MIYWGNEVLCGLCVLDTGLAYKYTYVLAVNTLKMQHV